jgi:hypothetical protein
MRLNPTFRRFAAAGLAVVVLVSSLTCMTVACRVVCAAEAKAKARATNADLPPCHRAAAAAPAGGTSAPAPAPGDCNSGTVCCSTWLHDRDVYVVPAPILVRAPFADDAPALVPAATSVPSRAETAARLIGSDPPDPHVAPLATPRASRAPPAA